MDPALRDEAKQWYDGARKQVMGRSLRAGAASGCCGNCKPFPQRLVHEHVFGGRMMDVYSYRQDYVADAEMNKAFTRIVLKDEKGKLIQVSKIAKDTTREALSQRDIWKK